MHNIMHNILSAIPWTDQTNPAKFPPYEYREFPTMLADKQGKNICNERDEPLIFQDQEQLDDYLEAHPDVVERLYKPMSEADRLEQENTVIRKLLAENEKLKAQLKANDPVAEEPETPKQARIRRAKKRNKAALAGKLKNLE